MADGFEIQVPITIKGGREGEKVGTQIGEKIASQLKKSLKAIGTGTGKAPSTGEIAGITGISKGFKGMTAKLGLIGAGIATTVGLLAQSSPYLKGILSIFGRAFTMFFRPFGDFLATLLRPLAILMMKMAVAFLKWTRPLTGAAGKGAEMAPQIPTTGKVLPDIGIGIANWALKLGGAIGGIILEIGKAAFNLGKDIGQWLLDYVIFPAGKFISDKILEAFSWVAGIGSKIWEDILRPAWMFLSNVGQWIWDQIILPAWSFLNNVGKWIWDQIVFPAFNFLKDAGSWIWNQIILPAFNFLKDAGSWLWDQVLFPAFNFLKDIGTWIWDILKPPFQAVADAIQSAVNSIKNLGGSILSNISSAAKSALKSVSKVLGKGQVGIPNVPREGLYYLHKGEEVIPKTRVGNKSMIFRPTFNITGNVTKDIDIDAIVRRAGRMTEMELKQRGII